MRIRPNDRAKEVFQGEAEHEKLTISYGNRGDPFRQGVNFRLERGGEETIIFFENSEMGRLRDILLELSPLEPYELKSLNERYEPKGG